MQGGIKGTRSAVLWSRCTRGVRLRWRSMCTGPTLDLRRKGSSANLCSILSEPHRVWEARSAHSRAAGVSRPAPSASPEAWWTRARGQQTPGGSARVVTALHARVSQMWREKRADNGSHDADAAGIASASIPAPARAFCFLWGLLTNVTPCSDDVTPLLSTTDSTTDLGPTASWLRCRNVSRLPGTRLSSRGTVWITSNLFSTRGTCA
jgi:hypothetical protein